MFQVFSRCSRFSQFGRVFACSLLLLLGIAGGGGAVAWGLDFNEFEALDEAKKIKLAKKYIKPAGKYHTMSLKRYEIFTNRGSVETLRTAVMMDDFYNSFSLSSRNLSW